MSEIENAADAAVDTSVSIEAPDTSMSDPLDAVDTVDYDDRGQLVVQFKDEPAIEEPADEPAPEAKTPPTTNEADPYEERYKQVQSWATRVSQENARIARENAYLQGLARGAGVDGKQEQKQDEQPEFDPTELLTDPRKFREFVSDQASRIAEERIRPYMPVLENAQIGQELHNTIQRYGDDFVARVPQIGQVFKALAAQGVENTTYEQAYLLARQLYPGAPEGAQQGEQRTPAGAPAKPGAAAPSRKVEAARLQQKASLKQETGVAGPAAGDVPKPPPKNLNEAFNRAIRDLGGS